MKLFSSTHTNWGEQPKKPKTQTKKKIQQKQKKPRQTNKQKNKTPQKPDRNALGQMEK